MNKQIKQISFNHDPENAKFDEAVESNEHLKNIDDTLKKPLKVDMPDLEMTNAFVTGFLKAIKGEKGDTPVKGKDYYTPEEIKQAKDEITPIRGKDYYTPDEIEEIKKEITPVKGEDYFDGQDGEDGYTPKKGVDYFDGKDADEEKIIAEIVKKIPEPKAGKDGISPDPKDVITEIKKLVGNDRLDISNIRNGEQLAGMLRKGGKMGQMLHGGGISDIRDEGVKILNISALDFIGAGVTLSYQANGVVVVSIPGGSGANQANNEIPGGAIDGGNTVFTLANSPVNTSLMLYLNGQLLTLTEDYTLVGANLTLINAPLSGGILRAFYQY